MDQNYFDRNTLVSLYADESNTSTIFSSVSEPHTMHERVYEVGC